MENNDKTINTETSAISLSSTNIETIPTSSVFDNLVLDIIYDEFNGKVYIDKDNHRHLFINDKEMTNGKIAIESFMYDKEHWLYRDTDKYVHLFKNDVELTEGIKTMGILQDPRSGKWLYANEKNKLILLN